MANPSQVPGPRTPILITGSHRSGTTWMGKTLAQAPSVLYIPEPFNPRVQWSPMLARQKPVRIWFTYIYEDIQAEYVDYLNEVLAIARPLLSVWLSRRWLEHPLTTLKRWSLFYLQKVHPMRPLMKDPIALLSAEWLAQTYAMQVVVMVRHPAAFVNSLLHLNWNFDYAELTKQPRVIADLFPEYEERIREFAQGNPSTFERGVFQWVLLHHVIQRYQERHPDWIFLRHEDLSQDPVTGFQDLCRRLGLKFSRSVRAYVDQTTDPSNLVNTPDPLDTRRDTKSNVDKWRKSLSRSQIDYIRQHVEPLSSHFYSAEEW